MSVPYPIISADKRGERDGFRSREGRIPAGSVLHRRDHLTGDVLVLLDDPVAYQLVAVARVLPLAQPAELLGPYRAAESIGLGQLAVPLTLDCVGLLPVVLLGRSEFLLVIGLRLAGAERF